MKPFKKLFVLATTLLSLGVTACNQTAKSEESVPEEPVGPSVFVLTGQSNMEGQTAVGTNNTNLKNAFTALGIEDGDCCIDGIPEVQTSFYGCGYGELGDNKQIHASNTTDKIAGKFLDTKVGMGAGDRNGNDAGKMGPELGMAYKLKTAGLATEENKIYFIKCGISGSGFAQSGNNAINWDVDGKDGQGRDRNLYKDHLKPYTQNCLNLIEEETGMKPVIRGFVWMQGESDSATEKIKVYNQRMNRLLDTFKEDFAEYAKNEEKENIAFLDATIYDKIGGQWGDATSLALNQEKMKNAEEHDNYYIVNTSFRIEGGLQLAVGSPGGDNMHYCTKDSFRLGMAFADLVIDNNLLD